MSKNMVQQFDAWHKTKLGRAVFGALELAIAFSLAFRALDTGSWWEYGFGLLFLIGGVQNLVRLVTRKQ